MLDDNIFSGPQPSLTTPRLVLRPFLFSDAEELEVVINDRAIAEGTLSIPYPYPKGKGIKWILTHKELWLSGRHAIWCVAERSSARIVGAISLSIRLLHNKGELGYWIGRDYLGKGYATESGRRIVGFGFDKLDLHRIEAQHFVQNPGSGRVLRKLGMQYEGLRRGAVVRSGIPRDVVSYAILETDPRLPISLN